MSRLAAPFALVSALLLVALLTLVGPGCGPGTPEGCTKDTDCKGERICDYGSGRCIEPGAGDDAGVPEEDGGLPDEDGGVDADGGVDGGEDAGLPPVTPCRDGGDCFPNRYTDTARGDYPTTNFPLMRLLEPSGNRPPKNHDGEVTRWNAWAEGALAPFWLMDYVDSSGQTLIDLFGGEPVRVARLFVIVDSTGASAGLPVMETAPDAAGNSPLLQIVEIQMVAGYVADTLKSSRQIQNALKDVSTGALLHGTSTVVTSVAVDKTVGMQGLTDSPGMPRLEQFWYDGQTVHAYRLPGSQADGSMRIDVPSANPDVNPPKPALSKAWQFFTAASPCPVSASVLYTRFGNATYAPVVDLQLTTVPSCQGLPTSTDGVQAKIDDGSFTVSDSVVVLRPQAP